MKTFHIITIVQTALLLCCFVVITLLISKYSLLLKENNSLKLHQQSSISPSSLSISTARTKEEKLSIPIEPQISLTTQPTLESSTTTPPKQTKNLNEKKDPQIIRKEDLSKAIDQNRKGRLRGRTNKSKNPKTEETSQLSYEQQDKQVYELKYDGGREIANCPDNEHRDYKENPIKVRGKFSGEFPDCPIRCVGDLNPPDVFSGKDVPTGGCPHTFSYQFSMENIQFSKGSAHSLIGTTDLTTDVPVQTFSWAEYSYMSEPKPKTATAMMAVFISNCGPTKRLNIIKELQEHGVTIHSYGRCLHNTEMPDTRDGDYLGIKTRVTSAYKFVFAAENSETDDYVTEKLFGTLDSGSVPVYLGAANVKKFAPSDKSVISVSDFATIKELAEYLIMLDKDDDKYNEYLKWKEEGPSSDFIALMDMAIVHSSCRLCIKVGDYYRKIYNNQIGHQLIPKETLTEGGILINVRPRGEFYMKQIELLPNEMTLKHLKKKIQKLYADNPLPVGSIHSIYRLWDKFKTPIKDDDFRNGAIYNNVDLEVIFLYPYHSGRGKFNEWQQTHQFQPH